MQLEVDDYPDIKSGYTLSLEFADNPYIADKRIVKAFNFSQDGRCSITGVQLNWKGEVRGSRDAVEAHQPDSLPPYMAMSKYGRRGARLQLMKMCRWQDLVEEEMAQEGGGVRGYGLMCWLAEGRELELGETDQYADIIKDQLWPNPMRFLTGEGDGVSTQLIGATLFASSLIASSILLS